MKKLLFALALLFTFSCCYSANKNYEEKIRNFIERNVFKGVKTDMKIRFITSSISDIHVSDSVAILEKQFQEEKKIKIENAQKIVDINQKAVDEQKARSDSDFVAAALARSFTKDLEISKEKLKEAQEWQPDFLDKYKNRNPDEVIALKVDCKFTYQDPRLTTRQEKEGVFLLSADGKTVHKMIK